MYDNLEVSQHSNSERDMLRNSQDDYNVDLYKPLASNAEAYGYKRCQEICGDISRVLQCCCACCGGGPLITVNQGYVGMRMSFGKYVEKLPPGLYSYNPCSESITQVDMRAQVINIAQQTLLTKDNVTLYIDAYVNFRVVVPENAIFKVVDYRSLINFMTQGTMKTIIAEHTLTEMLGNRKVIEKKITEIIDEKTDPYGVKVFNIETQRIQLPKEMDRAMATVAESEKQSEARIIDAKGSLESAKIFKKAADELGKNDISLQLQYFETLKYIAAEKNSTIIVPDSILNAVRLQK